jgi:hypothetical protein
VPALNWTTDGPAAWATRRGSSAVSTNNSTNAGRTNTDHLIARRLIVSRLEFTGFVFLDLIYDLPV